MKLSADQLRELFHYDPATGLFTRIKITAPLSAAAIGSVAGFRHSSGYWHIKIKCRQYKAHRLAWLYMTGEWPGEEVDHIDTDPSNNRWANLRVASRSQNQCNIGPRRNSKSGIKGVHWDKSAKKWRATIMLRGKQTNLGYYIDLNEARQAYVIASSSLHGQFARF